MHRHAPAAIGLVDEAHGLDETAAVLGVSAKTVQRDWITARAWLRKELAAPVRA